MVRLLKVDFETEVGIVLRRHIIHENSAK